VIATINAGNVLTKLIRVVLKSMGAAGNSTCTCSVQGQDKEQRYCQVPIEILQ